MVCTSVLHDINSGSLPDFFKTTKQKRAIHLASGYGLDVFKRFLKMEKSILDAKNILKSNHPENAAITADQLKAFESFKHLSKDKSNILFDETKSGVHAELQILVKVISKITDGNIPPPDRIHIGISKRCCLDCHLMLEAANQVLKERSISLVFSGAHDKQVKGWLMPDHIKPDLERLRSETKKKDIADQSLFSKIHGAYEQMKQESIDSGSYYEVSGGYDIRHPYSEGEVSIGPNDRLERYKKNLEKDLSVFLKYDAGDSQQARMLSIGVGLCSTDSFATFFGIKKFLSGFSSEEDQASSEEEALTSMVDHETSFYSMFAQLNRDADQAQKVSERELLDFLTSANFCEQEISSIFENFLITPDGKLSLVANLNKMTTLLTQLGAVVTEEPSPVRYTTPQADSAMHREYIEAPLAKQEAQLARKSSPTKK